MLVIVSVGEIRPLVRAIRDPERAATAGYLFSPFVNNRLDVDVAQSIQRIIVNGLALIVRLHFSAGQLALVQLVIGVLAAVAVVSFDLRPLLLDKLESDAGGDWMAQVIARAHLYLRRVA